MSDILVKLVMLTGKQYFLLYHPRYNFKLFSKYAICGLLDKKGVGEEVDTLFQDSTFNLLGSLIVFLRIK